MAQKFTIPRSSRILGAAGLLIAFSACDTALSLYSNSRYAWPPDSAIYLNMTLRDRGVPADSARKAENQFMLAEVNRSADADALRPLFSEHPPSYWVDQHALFANRPLYPLLSAALYPAFGPLALRIVSGIAYFSALIAMFALLLLITSPIRAGIGTLVFGTQQAVLTFATMALTDELALLFWICALGAIIGYQRKPATLALVGVCIASIALTLTRPAFFIPLGAAIASYDVMRRRFRPATAVAPVVAVTFAALIYFAYTASVHGPSVLDQLRWLYAWQQSVHGAGTEHGPVSWYLSSILLKATGAMGMALNQLGGAGLFILALLGAFSYRTSGPVRIGIASVAAISIAFFINPTNDSPARQVLLPIAPIIVLLAVVGCESFRVPKRTAVTVLRHSDRVFSSAFSRE